VTDGLLAVDAAEAPDRDVDGAGAAALLLVLDAEVACEDSFEPDDCCCCVKDCASDATEARVLEPAVGIEGRRCGLTNASDPTLVERD
jgi:hypothetical protein